MYFDVKIYRIQYLFLLAIPSTLNPSASHIHYNSTQALICKNSKALLSKLIENTQDLVVQWYPPWGGEVTGSTRGEGEACPGPVRRYRQRLAPGLGGGPQEHLVNKKKKKLIENNEATLIFYLTTLGIKIFPCFI